MESEVFYPETSLFYMGWKELTDNVAKKVVNTFTTEATYQPASGPSKVIKGVFDAEFIEVVILDGAEVQSVYPAFFIRLADLSAKPTVGDRLTIGATQYRVAEHRPDGEAGSLLILNKI